jgi:hypothetical protein
MHIVVVAYSLSRGENASSSSQQLSSPPKATFFRTEEKSLSSSLSLSLSVLRAKTEREKDIEKGVSFPSSLPHPKKIKKTGESTQKREKKILPTPFARTKIFFDDDDDARKQKRSPTPF